MNREYRYRLDNHAWYWTVFHIAVFGVAFAALPFVFEGGYMTAWCASLLAAVIALMTLSIPRRVVLTETAVEIRCISDLTTLSYTEIVSVRKVPAKETALFVPLFASVGFFGYYGRFLNLRRMEPVNVYASTWRNFVEITDLCEEKYYISCDKADEFVFMVGCRLQPTPKTENEDA